MEKEVDKNNSTVMLFFGILILTLLAACQEKPHNRTLRGLDNCSNHLLNVTRALHNYQSDYGSLPVAPRDGAGNARYSWRVLILPYCNCREQYEQFNLDASWDSIENLEIQIPEIFCCSTLRGREDGRTTYLIVNGSGSNHEKLQQDPEERKTIGPFLIDSSTKSVFWSKPEDETLTGLSDLKLAEGSLMQHPGVLVADFNHVYRLGMTPLPEHDGVSPESYLRSSLTSKPPKKLSHWVFKTAPVE